MSRLVIIALAAALVLPLSEAEAQFMNRPSVNRSNRAVSQQRRASSGAPLRWRSLPLRQIPNGIAASNGPRNLPQQVPSAAQSNAGQTAIVFGAQSVSPAAQPTVQTQGQPKVIRFNGMALLRVPDGVEVPGYQTGNFAVSSSSVPDAATDVAGTEAGNTKRGQAETIYIQGPRDQSTETFTAATETNRIETTKSQTNGSETTESQVSDSTLLENEESWTELGVVEYADESSTDTDVDIESIDDYTDELSIYSESESELTTDQSNDDWNDAQEIPRGEQLTTGTLATEATEVEQSPTENSIWQATVKEAESWQLYDSQNENGGSKEESVENPSTTDAVEVTQVESLTETNNDLDLETEGLDDVSADWQEDASEWSNETTDWDEDTNADAVNVDETAMTAELNQSQADSTEVQSASETTIEEVDEDWSDEEWSDESWSEEGWSDEGAETPAQESTAPSEVANDVALATNDVAMATNDATSQTISEQAEAGDEPAQVQAQIAFDTNEPPATDTRTSVDDEWSDDIHEWSDEEFDSLDELAGPSEEWSEEQFDADAWDEDIDLSSETALNSEVISLNADSSTSEYGDEPFTDETSFDEGELDESKLDESKLDESKLDEGEFDSASAPSQDFTDEAWKDDDWSEEIEGFTDESTFDEEQIGEELNAFTTADWSDTDESAAGDQNTSTIATSLSTADSNVDSDESDVAAADADESQTDLAETASEDVQMSAEAESGSFPWQWCLALAPLALFPVGYLWWKRTIAEPSEDYICATATPTRQNVTPTAQSASPQNNTAQPAVQPAPSPTDDLTRLEGITPPVASLLNALGIRSFKRLSSAKPEELRAVITKGGLQGKVLDPAVWIQQAQFAARNDWDNLSKWQSMNSHLFLAPGTQPSANVDGDDLTRIRGIDANLAKHLASKGINSFADLSQHSATNLRILLSDAGPNYAGIDPRPWPGLAGLAHRGDWTKLNQLNTALEQGLLDATDSIFETLNKAAMRGADQDKGQPVLK